MLGVERVGSARQESARDDGRRKVGRLLETSSLVKRSLCHARRPNNDRGIWSITTETVILNDQVYSAHQGANALSVKKEMFFFTLIHHLQQVHRCR